MVQRNTPIGCVTRLSETESPPVLEEFGLCVRFLLEHGAIELEDASRRGYVHRGHITGFIGVFDQERAAGEHVLARNLMSVLVLRVVEFSEEGCAQRHMNVVNFTEPVEGPFTVLVHPLVQRIAFQLVGDFSPSPALFWG